jgi:hypothetical protein
VAEPAWVIVLGSAMSTGKTSACASLIHGLGSAGRRVGAAKLTGTASARDVASFGDAGAATVVDFSDLGWPSTVACRVDELRDIVVRIAAHLRAANVDVAVLEIGDGLLQPETALVVDEIADILGAVSIVLTAGESLAALAGTELLARRGHRVMAVSGVVTNSPLARREVELAGSGPCIATAALGDELAPRIIEFADARTAQPAVVVP